MIHFLRKMSSAPTHRPPERVPPGLTVFGDQYSDRPPGSSGESIVPSAIAPQQVTQRPAIPPPPWMTGEALPGPPAPAVVPITPGQALNELKAQLEDGEEPPAPGRATPFTPLRRLPLPEPDFREEQER